MSRAGYDATFPVCAAWALEFAPVNVSVIFAQPQGNEHFVIGSRTWFFEELAACIAEAREAFPWRVADHIIPRENVPVWRQIFEELGLFNTEYAPVFPDPQRMLLTQQFLRRVRIDTAARPWAPDGNNPDLVDSLSGYRVKELASHAEAFTLNILGTHEQYLSRALEHYAAYHWLERKMTAAFWHKPPDYTEHDKAAI